MKVMLMPLWRYWVLPSSHYYVGTQTMEGSTGLIVTAIVSFLVMLAVVYADRNLKRARRVVPRGLRQWHDYGHRFQRYLSPICEDVFVHYRSLRNKIATASKKAYDFCNGT